MQRLGIPQTERVVQNDNLTGMCPPWAYPSPSALAAAIAHTAEQLRQAYQRPAAPIVVTFPYNPARRGQFVQEQRDAHGQGFVFDWSLWPIGERPGKALTARECAQITERVNASLAAVSPRAYAAAGSGPATAPAFACR